MKEAVLIGAQKGTNTERESSLFDKAVQSLNWIREYVKEMK